MNDKTTLKCLLSYENPEVIARFCQSFGVSKKEAQGIFKDMLRFLWLTERARCLRQSKHSDYQGHVPNHIPMLDPMMIIDEMWHTFVLYTSEYAEFSFKYLGKFIHHIPTPVLKKGSKPSRKDLENYAAFVWDELGEDVVDRWFIDYPKKYSKMEIKRLQLVNVEAA